MQAYKSGPRNRVTLGLIFLLLGFLTGIASAQNSTNSASVAKPVLPDTAEPGKSEQPAAPDTTPPRVADVQPSTFVIGVEDILNVNVWKEPEMSRTLPVRPDGMITLPLIGEIK